MIEYNNQNFKDITPIGDLVFLKKLVNHMEKKYGDIILTPDYAANYSFGIAEVIKLGTSDAVKDSGLTVGDFVLYDYHSVFHDNPEYVLTKVENIILKITTEEAEKLSSKKLSFN